MMEHDLLKVSSEFQSLLADYARLRDERVIVQKRITELETKIEQFRRDHTGQLIAVSSVAAVMRSILADIHTHDPKKKISEEVRSKLDELRTYLAQLP